MTKTYDKLVTDLATSAKSVRMFEPHLRVSQNEFIRLYFSFFGITGGTKVTFEYRRNQTCKITKSE